MTIRIRLFGPQAQLVGRREIAVELPEPQTTCAHLRAVLARNEPRLATSLASSRWAVNQRFAAENEPVGPGDEVALIGMINGG